MEIFVLGDIWEKGTEPMTVRHTCTDIIFYPLSPSKASGFCELQCRPLNMEAVMMMLVLISVFSGYLFIIHFVPSTRMGSSHRLLLILVTPPVGKEFGSHSDLREKVDF